MTAAEAMTAAEVEPVGRSLASAGIGMFLAGPAGELLWLNEALKEAIGPAAGRSLDDVLEGGWGTRGSTARQPWPRAGAERTVRLKGDRPRYFTLVTADSGADSHLGVLIDCTDRVRRDVEREERDVYLTRAAADSADAFVSLDRDGRIRQWNDGAQSMFGFAAEDVLGRPYDDLLVPAVVREAGDLKLIDELMARDGFVRGYETMRMAKGGRLIPVDLTVTRLFDEAGRPAGRSVIYRDISVRIGLEAALRNTVEELREANRNSRVNQERLIALERLSAIGEMSARVAHEIRTPLVTIGGFANTLLRESAPDSPQRQYLEIIREEVRRLEAIVSEILEYVRPPRADLEPCEVNDILRRAIRPFEEGMAQKRIEARWRLMEGLPPVTANRYQLHQVFSNLLQNAVQAMPGGGSLTVTTETGTNHVRIAIADSGVGIPASDHDRVFKPFYTTKASGSGLGLAITSKLVAQNDGTISFTSEEGRGATFEVRLPLSREGVS